MSSLREKLKALEELQQVDLDSNEVRAELETIPAKRAEIDQRVAEARRAYDEEKARVEGNERERRQLESLLAMERDKVKKWEGRLGEIRTPREYAALSREIDIAKKTNEGQSEQIKALVARAEFAETEASRALLKSMALQAHVRAALRAHEALLIGQVAVVVAREVGQEGRHLGLGRAVRHAGHGLKRATPTAGSPRRPSR